MPLLQVCLGQGLIAHAKRKEVIDELTGVFLTCLGVASDNMTARSITRVEWTELAADQVHQDIAQDAPVIRLTFSVPVGALSADAKSTLAAACDDILKAAMTLPPDNYTAQSRWSLFFEVPDGNWASNGEIKTWHSIKRFVARGEIARRRAGK